MRLYPFVATLLFFATVLTHSLKAQTTFELPEKIVLEADSDYVKYEPLIIEAAQWLEDTDLDKETEKRAKVNNFVIRWISGSPFVTIDITKGITDLYDGNPILSVFLSSYTRYVLQHRDDKGSFNPTKEAILAMMRVYKKGIGIKQNKKMDKAIQMNDKGKLDDYIETEVGIDRED